ncbi:MAG TPA: MBL fold metallo-hydrolase [Pseudonocardia sp.]|nr:MBL fold metallo-hydrolase [Pseudonocardia sp.]
MFGRWLELASGVFAMRCTELDLTLGLVVGTDRALVIDTRGDEAQGAEWAGAVRAVTDRPVAVVLTHAHFDHCFGTHAFLTGPQPTPVFAHRRCAEVLRTTETAQRAEWAGYYRDRGDDDTARRLEAARVVAPDHLVDEDTELDLGGRRVELSHPGAGHTDHDLVVRVPDAGVVFAGDLVEQGAPPDFSDALPRSWPDSLAWLLTAGPEIVVPGHGDPVTPEFVVGQRRELATVAALCAEVRSGTLTAAEAVRCSPYPEATTRVALSRPTIGP